MADVLEAEPKPAPVGPLRLTNAAGLSLELNRDGGARDIRFGGLAVNLFMGNGMEPSPANLCLRLQRGAKVVAGPLTGPRAPTPGQASPNGFGAAGGSPGVWTPVR